MKNNELGNMLLKYGNIVQDETYYKNGWKRIIIVKYNDQIYWIKMNGGNFQEIETI